MIWQADARIWKDNAAVVVGKTGKIFDPDGLMKTDDNQKLSVDKTTVDCNSYLYKFLDKYKGKENVFHGSDYFCGIMRLCIHF